MMNNKLNLGARILIAAMTAILSVGWLPAYAAPAAHPLAHPLAQSVQSSGQTSTQSPIPAGCETVAPEQLRDELNRVSQSIFAPETTSGTTTASNAVDIAAMVARQWRLVGVDTAIDASVDE